MAAPHPVIAIVGRPNVGKSTLFNRLVGRRLALTDDQPGVTRDLRENDARLGPLKFIAIDTAGLEAANDESLAGRMRRLSEHAVEMADIVFFVIDARAGITSVDQEFAGILRKSQKPILLLANKCEGRAADAGFYEAFSLGLGDPIAISSEHGEGMGDLQTRLEVLYLEREAEFLKNTPQTEVAVDEAIESRDIQIAVVGRPNAGKSTLINKIIGSERLLTGPEAGITRDAISVQTIWNDQAFRIWDTAGMRKKARVNEKLEKLSVADGLRAVRFAEVVIVLIDAAIPFESQDLKIADLAEREGRAVVFAVNKWDLEEARQEKLKSLQEAVLRHLPQLKGAPLVTVSAATGRGLARLQNAILSAHDIWNKRVSTALLNEWLAAMIIAHPPPAPNGRRIRLRYITQVKTRPPSFVVMCSRPDQLPASYSRYLVNGLREDFGLYGTPIRLSMRSQSDKNPYKDVTPKRVTKLNKHLEGRFQKDRKKT